MHLFFVFLSKMGIIWVSQKKKTAYLCGFLSVCAD